MLTIFLMLSLANYLYRHFMAFIQDNLHQPASPVKNWRILLNQSINRILFILQPCGWIK